MSQYIIDIDDEPFERDGEKLWRATQFKSLVFDDYGLKRLTPSCTLYNAGLHKGWQAATELVHDAWNLYVSGLQKKYDIPKLNSSSGNSICEKAFNSLTPQKAIRQQEMATYQVGDVICDDDDTYLIVSINEDGYKVIKGSDFEPASIGKDCIRAYVNLHDRKDMEEFKNGLEI